MKTGKEDVAMGKGEEVFQGKNIYEKGKIGRLLQRKEGG